MRMEKREVMIPVLLDAWDKGKKEKDAYKGALCRALADVSLLRAEIESKLYSLSMGPSPDLATPTPRPSSRRSRSTR